VGELVGIAHVRAVIALFAIALAAPLFGHELGIVQVDATFRKDATYSVDLLVDPQHHNIQKVADGAVVSFDGKPAKPERFITANRIYLKGRTPAGVSSFTFADDAITGLFVVKAGNVLQWVDGGQTSPPYLLDRSVVPPTRWAVVKLYLGLGFTHILPRGLDHVLFVLGIFLLATQLRAVLWQVSAFTLAHTMTLALTVYGVVSLPSRIVEPLIALSIVYVAVENIFTSKLHAWRPVIVFCFGLLHGMGFAGVLNDIGLPRSEFVPALLSFNAGVECGQLAVIFTAFLLLGMPFRRKEWYRSRVVVAGSLIIAALGLYWTMQRVFLAA
jgi:hypothetical protein